MNDRPVRSLIIGAAAVSLAACGGGGGGVNSTPTPAPTPTRLGYQPVAATETVEFAVAGGDLRIRWDNDSKAYELMLPGQDWAKLSADGDFYTVAGSNTSAYFSGSGRYSYTGIAKTDVPVEVVAYGLATPLSGVPVTGSASYLADLVGDGGGYVLGGTGRLDFDFAAGSLAGFFDAIAKDPMDGADAHVLGRYDFTETVFSGGQNFSGSLSHAGTADGSFSGLFTGPHAQELMGQWELPFTDPAASGTTLTGTGVFVGKQTP